MTIDDFLKTRYVKHGRIAPDLDCWGLVRLARVELFGRELLPSYDGINPSNKPELTKATLAVKDVGDFIDVGLKLGSIATAWRGSRCQHVGLVVDIDGRLMILETDEGVGARLTSPALFERRYTKVIYYDN